MKPEAQFLVAAVRAFLHPTESDGLVALAGQVRDWNQLLEMAARHAVSPILYHVVTRLPQGSVRQEWLDELHSFFAGNARSNLQRAGELVRLMELFSKRDICALPLKGPLLAARIYGDLALRSFADLDFLFPVDQIKAAREVLVAAGYEMSSTIHWSAEAAYLRSINSEFLMQRGELLVDVHWRLIPEYFPFRIEQGALWSARGEVRLAGRSVPSLCAEHQLLYLAAHGAKHCWSRLAWICDLARFVQVMPIDWKRAAALCSEAGSQLILTHALALVRDVLGVALPEQAERLIDSDARAQELAAAAGSRLFLRREKLPGPVESLRFTQAFVGGAADGLRLWYGMMIAPTEAEWRVIRLPPALYGLYYPLRVVRLAGKTLARLVGIGHENS